METKEQKIERLKKEIEEIKFYKSICIDTYAVGIYIEQIKKLEQELKELEDDTKKSRQIHSGSRDFNKQDNIS